MQQRPEGVMGEAGWPGRGGQAGQAKRDGQPERAKNAERATAEAFAKLCAKLQRVHLLGTVSGLLGWDEQVNLPPGSAGQRGAQAALLAELQHAAAVDEEIGRCLAVLTPGQGASAPDARELSESEWSASEDNPALSAPERAVVAVARRDYVRAQRLPAAFMAEKARLSSEAYHAWVQAKARADFAAFAPFLSRQLALAQEEATLVGWGERPYDYALDRHDPGVTTEQLQRWFTELQEGLVPLVREVVAVRTREAASEVGEPKVWALAGQRELAREVTAALGFDYACGRLDESPHPFCEGSAADVRLTTRFVEAEPLVGLLGAIHEAGHGMYEQALPQQWPGTALAQATGMGVHESQSRLWENQVGRSAAFWRWLEPRCRERFPQALAGVPEGALARAANEIRPGLIRIEADELHYNLHILLRFDLERRLFAGTLAVKDLPAEWARLSLAWFGRAPRDDAEGVLQDVHWSGGAFGYFPSYTLGNLIAAQLWAKVRAVRPTLEEELARGDFAGLRGWLRAEVQVHGRQWAMPELVRRATGAELSPQYLLAYLRERHLPGRTDGAF